MGPSNFLKIGNIIGYKFDMNNKNQFLNGIQINPLSFVDEGVEECIANLKNRFQINSIFLCTVSWLALKIGRSISYEYDGWPDHGRTI